jgi:signal transduction histidine kinase
LLKLSLPEGITNAVKFTPDGGLVEIQLQQIGSQAQIQVTDTGKGIFSASSDFNLGKRSLDDGHQQFLGVHL